MAYPYFAGYPSGGYPQYPQPVQQPQTMQYQQGAPAPMPVQQQQTTSQTPQIQSGGLVPVKSYAEVDSWQIAPGNSMTFYLEGNGTSLPIIFVKKKGFSQFDPTTLDVYDLVKRKNAPQNAQSDDTSNVPTKDIDLSNYATIADFDALRAKYESITHNVDKLAELIEKMQFDIDAMSDKKSTKKMVQNARKDADAE